MIYSLTNETEDSIIYLKLIESSLDRILYLSSVPFRKLIPCTIATRNMLPVFPCFTIGDFFLHLTQWRDPAALSKVELKIFFPISFALDINITAQGERKRHSHHSCLVRRKLSGLIISSQGPVP